MATSPDEVDSLLADSRSGNRDAGSKLFSLVYDELRRLASHYMRRERGDHTLQTTALVHETYLRLVGQREVSWQNRAHFFGVAAQLMRRILVDHARARQTAKRGPGQHKILLEEEGLIFSDERSGELVALDEALVRLAEVDPRQARIVELRHFAGLSVEETAEVLEISPRTVKREWSVARAWLRREIKEDR